MTDRVPHGAWWDLVPYYGGERQLVGMQIERVPAFQQPCGFIPLRERHTVKAERTVVNSQDRHCRIGKVILK